MIEILYDFEKKLPDNVTIIDKVNVYANGNAKKLKQEKSKNVKSEVGKNGK